MMRIQNGHNILDVGCGPGIDTIHLAKFVGPTGQVTGIDIDHDMVDLANKIAVENKVANWVVHKRFDAEYIPYNNDFFDSCRCERLLQHLLHPESTISEMVRVTKPNGWIVVADTDHSTMSIDAPDIDIEWKLRRFHTEIFKNGYAGRQLFRLVKQQNLADIEIEIFPLLSTDYMQTRYMALLDTTENAALEAGILNEEELKHWHNSLERINRDGKFFCSVTIVLIAGRKQT